MTRPTTATILLGNNNESDSTPPSDSNLLVEVAEKEKLSSSLKSVSPDSLDSIEIIIPTNLLQSLFDPLALAGLTPTLRSGCTLKVKLLPTPTQLFDLEAINTAFLLAGLQAQSEQREEDGTRILTARKGQFHSSSAAISLPRNSEEKKSNDDTGKPVKISQKVMIDNLDGDADDGLIDEEELLEGDGDGFLSPPPADTKTSNRSSADDCGGRKACDNCSCGRAESEAQGVRSSVPMEPLTSSCGNCGKGDAFRCASCPFLGKPAFKPGEEHLVLNLTDDI